MSLPRYPKYKDSGVEWLGEVPEGWKISRLGFESWVRARLGWKGLKAEEYVDDGFVFLSTPNIKPICIDFEDVNYIDADRYEESPEIKLRVGDVLLAKDGSTLGTVNVVRFLPRPSTVNSSIAVITPNSSLDGIFLFYLFQSTYMDDTIQRIKGGMGIPHLFQADLNKFYIPVPQTSEQMAIEAFLDRETAKIDALVEEQRRLIELLKEKRRAVISHAVTKGLNPRAKMKPSGIEWLGDVPEHWTIHPLRRFPCLVQTGPFGSQLHADEYITGGIPVINPVNLVGGRIDPSEDVTVSEDVADRLHHQRLRVGDIVFSRRGELGRCALVSEMEEGWLCGTGSMIVRLECTDYFPGYLSCFLSLPLLRQYFESFSVGSIMDSLSSETLLAMPMIVPPLNEQSSIVDFVDIESTKLDALTAEANRAIDLLQERRTALISAAVTGKIDVRGAIHAER
jgi:type I restriction enzyme S subunit